MNQKELSFEDASKKLDEIIAKLENGALSLDESVKLFEEANALVSICQKHFMLAKGKLSVIRDGFEDVLKEFE
ncbi:MAG: exodeoxyribonuclease VII small subunit [Clostridia bacterium]|nr:exodeoxyribonuclease VII small subunit [Clostridia bacterium]